ncbi:RsfA family transcriptional regulator [Pseudalkalibacillus hwajinpoensis]|uniref:RsfA family transcriptional regulator n=1 Tax=Guptibacillus hwajinpoensis TaxID=208199 RepID=A0A4V5PYI9_9BACL|nr:RsfA family transcriptional regulator [Pseudalkalibacillus hwajinpoensis]TKD70248.1 RsfA family transcriptional regulator [Pseudalkalibacillus hwajinpoensis]
MKVRQDAWSHEDDLMLAETVLRHVREGSTQLKAFDEVGDRLSRTSAAVGFRWNAIVRERYEQALKLAKKQRKEMKRAEIRQPTYTEKEVRPSMMKSEQTLSQTMIETPVKQTEQVVTQKQMTMRDVISYLSNLEQSASGTSRLRTNLEKLELENQHLTEENTLLHQRIKTLENEQQVMKEDYQSLIQIMDRARRMVVLNDNEDHNVPGFKMDKNGNLEKLAR